MKTAVEWLAEKLEYVNWMRNRDEIFPEIADQWRKHYLEQAKEMEKEQIVDAFEIGYENGACVNQGESIYHGHNYYNETFKQQ